MGTYRNVMELLIEEEVSKQLKALPPRTASYLNPTELGAYALNQLPALYATSQQGLEQQLKKGRSEMKTQIALAVRRAIAAVQRDPLRKTAPLPSQQEAAQLQSVLHRLKLLLKNDKLDWDNLPFAIEQVLIQTGYEGQPLSTSPGASLGASSGTSPSLMTQQRARSAPSAWGKDWKTQVGHPTASRAQPAGPSREQPEPEMRRDGWDDPLRRL